MIYTIAWIAWAMKLGIMESLLHHMVILHRPTKSFGFQLYIIHSQRNEVFQNVGVKIVMIPKTESRGFSPVVHMTFKLDLDSL